MYKIGEKSWQKRMAQSKKFNVLLTAILERTEKKRRKGKYQRNKQENVSELKDVCLQTKKSYQLFSF